MRNLRGLVSLSVLMLACGGTDDGAESLSGVQKMEIKYDNGEKIGTMQAVVRNDKVVIQGDIVVGKLGRTQFDKPLNLSLEYMAARWPDGKVPYAINIENDADGNNDGMGDDEFTVRAAIADVQARTRIQFEELIGPQFESCIVTTDRLQIVRSGDPNVSYSAVGFTGTCQELEIHPGASQRTATHELGHALGLFHEHTRPDRDTYVDICEQNIMSSAVDEFDIEGGTPDMLSDYDFASLMHYRRQQFGIWQLTPTLFQKQTIRLHNDPSCATNPGGLGLLAFSSNTLSPEDENSLLLMYARPLGAAEEGDETGYSLAMGDINNLSTANDAHDDLVVGAPGEAVGHTPGAGAVFVYRGTKKHPAPWHAILPPSANTNDRFGTSVVLADFDGDGDRDLAVGAPGDTPHGVSSGAVFVYTTDFDGFTLRHVLSPSDSFTGPDMVGDRFGTSLAVYDTDADGKFELAVGSPGRAGTGRVHLFAGTALGNFAAQPMASATLSPPTPVGNGVEFGTSLRFTDINANYAIDLMIGAPKGGTASAGFVDVFKFTSGVPSPLFRFEQPASFAPEAGDDFGASLGNSKLSNGAANVMVGAPGKRKRNTVARTGGVFVFSYSPASGVFGLLTSAFPGDTDAQRFGHAINAMVVNPPNESIVIGAPNWSHNAGRVVVMRLDPGNVLTKTHESTGLLPGSKFGSALAVGLANVATLPDPAGLPQSGLPPRLQVGAPGMATTGATVFLTVGPTAVYQRHLLTQESGSPYSEWDM